MKFEARLPADAKKEGKAAASSQKLDKYFEIEYVVRGWESEGRVRGA